MEDQQHLPEAAAFGDLGRWAGIVCAAGAVLYGVATIAVGILATSAITVDDWNSFVANYNPLPTLVEFSPPFIVTFAFPALMVAIYRAVAPERRPVALLAVTFAAIYTAVLGMAYWLQLTFVPQSIVEGNIETLELWAIWHPRSFFWAFESFGYLSFGIAAFCAGVALRGSPASRATRVALIALGPLGLLFMFNEAIGTAAPFALLMFLVFGWVVLTTVASVGLVRSFGRRAAVADAVQARTGEARA